MSALLSGHGRRRPVTLADGIRWGSLTIYCVVVPTLIVNREWALEKRFTTLFADDFFYYLVIAKNIVSNHWSTFDNLASTNGYHPFWMAIATTAVAIFGSKNAAHVISVINVALWIAALRYLYLLVRLCDLAPAFFVGMVWVFWYGCTFGGTGSLIFFNGMESSLASACIAAFSFHACKSKLFSAGPGSAREGLSSGFLLLAIILARLDSVLVVAGIGLVTAVAARRRMKAQPSLLFRLLSVFAPPLAGTICYMVLNRVFFDTWLPVSGQAKSLNAPFFAFDSLRLSLSYGYFWKLPFFSAAVSVSMGFLALALDWRSSRKPAPRHFGHARAVLGADEYRKNAASLLAAYIIGWTLQSLYLFVFVSWFVWGWYFYIVGFIAFLAVVLLCGWGLDRKPRLAPLVWSGGFLATLGCLAIAIHLYLPPLEKTTAITEDFIAQGHSAAQWLRAHDAAPLVYAMGDRAGAFAYFSGFRVVQLEGITNSAKFLLDLKKGRVNNRYLYDEGVRRYVASRRNEGAENGWVGSDRCSRLTEPNFGKGPKFKIIVCEKDLIYETDGPDGFFKVWNLRPFDVDAFVPQAE